MTMPYLRWPSPTPRRAGALTASPAPARRRRGGGGGGEGGWGGGGEGFWGGGRRRGLDLGVGVDEGEPQPLRQASADAGLTRPHQADQRDRLRRPQGTRHAAGAAPSPRLG